MYLLNNLIPTLNYTDDGNIATKLQKISFLLPLILNKEWLNSQNISTQLSVTLITER